jgi:MFS family permease
MSSSLPASSLLRTARWPAPFGSRAAGLARRGALGRMLVAGFISGWGNRVHQVALAALILGLTDSVGSAGLVWVVSTLPHLALGLTIGTLVDRWDRRVVMILADLVRAAVVIGIPLMALTSLPLAYGLLVVLSSATIVFNTARTTAVPELVDRSDLTAANSLLQATTYLTEMLGFPLAALLVAALTSHLGIARGSQIAFGLDGLSYLLSAALLVRLPSLPGRSRTRTRTAGILDGLRFVKSHPVIRTNVVLMTVGPLLLGSLHTLWIGFAWRVSHTESFGYGVTETSNAAGTLIGLWLLQFALRRFNKGRVILFGFLTMGAAILAAGSTDSLPIVALLASVSGVGNMCFLVPSITLLQEQTPAELRGRTVALRSTLTFSAFSVSNAVAGSLSDSVGVSPLFMALGGGMVAMALGAWLFASARDAT